MKERKRNGNGTPLSHKTTKTTPNVVPVAASTGSKISTVSQLNMSCTVAPAKALLYSFLLVIWPIDTMVLVTEVPILAPMMTGMAFFTGITENNVWKFWICNLTSISYERSKVLKRSVYMEIAFCQWTHMPLKQYYFQVLRDSQNTSILYKIC